MQTVEWATISSRHRKEHFNDDIIVVFLANLRAPSNAPKDRKVHRPAEKIISKSNCCFFKTQTHSTHGHSTRSNIHADTFIYIWSHSHCCYSFYGVRKTQLDVRRDLKFSICRNLCLYDSIYDQEHVINTLIRNSYTFACEEIKWKKRRARSEKSERSEEKQILSEDNERNELSLNRFEYAN